LNYNDFLVALPIETVAAFSLLVMLADALVGRSTKLCATLAMSGFVAGIITSGLTLYYNSTGFSDMLTSGGMANIYDMIVCAAGIMTVLLARDYLERTGGMYDEFYTLLMMSVAGMMLLAHSNDVMILFTGIEVMSVCFYVMAGIARGNVASNEAALKYFLLGAFASGFLLFGIALMYGATGQTSYAGIAGGIATSTMPAVFWIGVGLLIVGLAFKVAAAPFHQWAPDVYEGAPTVVTGFMSTAGKAAAFAGFAGVMLPVLSTNAPGVVEARTVLAGLAVASMLLGNITAVAQTNIKRMLAYSSIAHAGYLTIGLAAGNSSGSTGIMYYLAAYLFMQLGAFAVVGMLERENGGNLTIEEYRGLGRRKPGVAVVMSLFMFSLVGLPPFAGFFGKYLLFAAAIQSDMVWLAIVGVVSSVISAWFYLGLIVNMFFREPEGEPGSFPEMTWLTRSALAITIIGTLVLGLIPQLVLNAAGGR